jgi:hypothetical protein
MYEFHESQQSGHWVPVTGDAEKVTDSEPRRRPGTLSAGRGSHPAPVLDTQEDHSERVRGAHV